MIYSKPPLTLEQQTDLLLCRGMAGDRSVLVDRLRTVNYYRLSGYWYTFRLLPGDSFRPGTTFDVVWDRYVLDRKLRLVVMDAIERIEVAIRTLLAYHHAHRSQGPFAYADEPAALPGLPSDQRQRFLDSLREEAWSSSEIFVKHFRTKYGTDHSFMPVWMATEIMTFGCLLTFYRGATSDVRRAVAAELGIHDTVLESWLLALNTVRNICAHHGRLWNRQLGTRPKIPDKSPEWHHPIEVPNERVFSILTLSRYCLARLAPEDRWPDRLRALLAEHPQVPGKSMGFPPNWETCPIWRESTDGA